MGKTEIILRYLQVILSWPVVSLVLGVTFFKWFKEPISDFFRRVVKGEAYGFRVEAANPSKQRKEVKETPQFQSQDVIEKYIKENPKKVINEYAKVFNGYQFERAFNIIYGTQVDLLEHLSIKGTNGDKYVNLSVFYNECIKRAKSVFVQIAGYLGFLKDARFIEFVGKGSDLSVIITPHGVNFLSYIKNQYPTMYKHKRF